MLEVTPHSFLRLCGTGLSSGPKEMIPRPGYYLKVNERHQLLVSVSKHLYILKSGAMTYQQKAMEVNLKNFRHSGRERVLHYLIRDEASSMIYAELHRGSAPAAMLDFLFRAWHEKDHFYFAGMPQQLCAPATIYTEELGRALHALGIAVTKPESGFHAGVRCVRFWEEALTWFAFYYPGISNFAELRHYTEHLAHDLNRYDQSRIDLWERGVRDARYPLPEQVKPYCEQRVPVDPRAVRRVFGGSR